MVVVALLRCKAYLQFRGTVEVKETISWRNSWSNATESEELISRPIFGSESSSLYAFLWPAGLVPSCRCHSLAPISKRLSPYHQLELFFLLIITEELSVFHEPSFSGI